MAENNSALLDNNIVVNLKCWLVHGIVGSILNSAFNLYVCTHTLVDWSCLENKCQSLSISHVCNKRTVFSVSVHNDMC